MPTWEDVSRIALALPETVELVDTNGFRWDVRRNYFAWERPPRKADLARTDAPWPDGPVLGVRTDGLDDKRGLLGSGPDIFFTTPGYVEYPAVLVQLERISMQQLEEVLTDAWLARAPKRLAAKFLAEHP